MDVCFNDPRRDTAAATDARSAHHIQGAIFREYKLLTRLEKATSRESLKKPRFN